MKSNYTKVRVAQFLMFTLSLFAFLTVSTRMNGQATLPHHDPINYTAAATLQTQTSWTALNSGDDIVVSSGSLSYSGLPASTGNKATFGGAGFDAAKLFTQQTSGTVYASYILNVASLGSLNTTGGYQFAFNEGTGTTFGATVWLRADGTGYDIGINPKTTAANTQWSTGTQTINTPIFVVISYQMVSGTLNDVVKLWINPALGGAEPTATLSATNGLASDLANVNRFLVRQGSATDTPNIEFDELRIGTSWASVTPAGTAITPSVTSLTDFGSISVGASSTAQTFTVSGSNLTGSVTVTRPSTDFEISADGVDWSNATLTLTQTAGVLDGEPVTIYVRCSPASAGPLSGNVALSSSGATTVNVAVTGTGVGSASQDSDIIVDGGFTYTSNIAYASYQAADVTDANSVAIGQFIIRDGGASSPDADALSTILNDISFSVTNPGSLRSVALYDGTTELGEVAGGATLSFTGLTVFASDDATKTLTLYATFNSAVTDNQQFSVALATASDDNSGSLFGALGTPVTTTTTDENRIEVSATTFAFTTQPSNIVVDGTMSPNVVARARDINGNNDLDFVADCEITSSGTMTGEPLTVTAVAGVVTISGIVHTVSETGVTLSIASAAASIAAVSSATFDVTPLPILAFDFVGLAGDEVSAASTINDVNLTTSTITRGSGITTSANADRFGATGFTTAAVLDANDYFEFTVTPNAGYEFSVTSIIANLQRSGTGPTRAALRSSADAYASDLGSVAVLADVTTTQVATFTFTQSSNIAPVTYRLYLYLSENTTGTAGPESTGNDIEVYGSTGVNSTDCNDISACNYNAASSGTTQCIYPSTTYYIDVDGDGYASGTILACAPGVGYTTTVLPTGDCDDNNAAANPGIQEIDCDGIDNNCFAGIDEESVVGCQDSNASNYNPAATCPGTCTYSGSFTAGNLVVSRMGDGTAFPTGSTTYQVFLEQMTPAGTAVSSLPMPTVGGTRLTQAASSTAEGFITRTPDGEAVVFAGYDAAAGSALTGNARVANIIDLNYTTSRLFSSSTLYTGSTNFRSAVSDGTNAWTSGSGVGIHYATSSSATLISSAITNTRVVNIFNGELYFSTGSGTPGIYKVGTGLPTSSTTNSVVIATGSGSSPYDFVFSPDGNTLYVADDRTTTSGGVYKYTYDGSTWTQAAQFYLGSSYPAASSVLVDFYTYAQPKIYVVARLMTMVLLERLIQH
jgi:hypothetical protein